MTEYIYIYIIENANFMQNTQNNYSKEEMKMRVTIDLDRDIVIIPDNFFKKIMEENEKLEKYGAKPVKAIDRIKKSFEIAMNDTDNRLLTQSNAKTTTRARKSNSAVESVATSESNISADTATIDKK